MVPRTPSSGSRSNLRWNAWEPALAANLIVAIAATLIMRQLKMHNGTDQTSPADYHALVRANLRNLRGP